MDFDHKKDDFNKIFEADVNTTAQPQQPIQQNNTQPQQTEQTKSNTKEDKLDRLKQYDEYWNFEKNYHYNSKIDSVIKKINTAYNFDKKAQVKLMRDVINQICGSAAQYLGLSWDMIGDDKYLFGFYESNGSKNHMNILIPYDFKFSALKQKLLDWFLKKKEKPQQDATQKPKKPSIKIVENLTTTAATAQTSITDEANKHIEDVLTTKMEKLLDKYATRFYRGYRELSFPSDYTCVWINGLNNKNYPIKSIEYYDEQEAKNNEYTPYLNDFRISFWNGLAPRRWNKLPIDLKAKLLRKCQNMAKKDYWELKENLTTAAATSDLDGQADDMTLLFPSNRAYEMISDYVKNDMGIKQLVDDFDAFKWLSNGEVARCIDNTKIIIFSTRKQFHWEDNNELTSLGCDFFIRFNADDTFSFYTYIGWKGVNPQKVVYLLEGREYNDKIVAYEGKSGELRRMMSHNEFDNHPNSLLKLNVVKKFIKIFKDEAYDAVLSKIGDKMTPNFTENILLPRFESFISEAYTRAQQ